jgi:hypothetical protein
MNSISRAAVPFVAVWTTLFAAACSSGGSTSSSTDAAFDSTSGGGSGSSGSGSSGSSSSSGSSTSSGSSGSTSSSGSSDAASSGSGSGGSSASGSSSGSSGSSRAGDAGGDAGTCTTNADCGGGLCGFLQSAGCSAVGACFAMPGAICNAIVLGCACDGTSVNVACNGLPGGYTPKPFAHAGACGLDSGSQSLLGDGSAIDSSAADAEPTDAGTLMDGAACVASSGEPCSAGLSCCPTAGYFGAPTACTPTCTGAGCAGSCRALP